MKGSLPSFGILIEKIYLAVKGEIYLTTKEKKGGSREICVRQNSLEKAEQNPLCCREREEKRR